MFNYLRRCPFLSPFLLTYMSQKIIVAKNVKINSSIIVMNFFRLFLWCLWGLFMEWIYRWRKFHYNEWYVNSSVMNSLIGDAWNCRWYRVKIQCNFSYLEKLSCLHHSFKRNILLSLKLLFMFEKYVIWRQYSVLVKYRNTGISYAKLHVTFILGNLT